MKHPSLAANTAVLLAPTFRRRGFTLTEMAVVLVILALLIGGMVVPLTVQQDIRNASETQKLLSDVTEALYGYALTHSALDGRPHLPCPDTDGDGRENRSGTACVSPEGDLPWAELGLGRQDSWGNPLRYRVSDLFANRAAGFTLTTDGDLRICTDSTCNAVIADKVPAVILSLGKNGSATPGNADEAKNKTIAVADKDFVQRSPAPDGFDDIVAWLPRGILVNRLLLAGRLP
ncbi:MAG: type II secretion system GspH family protein [Rhodocyclaceae bacterium]|nr:type II secretion system GspH family protein [Rhodocyclaceae bacterium]